MLLRPSISGTLRIGEIRLAARPCVAVEFSQFVADPRFQWVYQGDAKIELLAGLVERATFHNPDNGFCVLRLKARGHRDLVTTVGHAAMISAGE